MKFYSVIVYPDDLDSTIEEFIKNNPSIVIEYESVRCVPLISRSKILYSFFYRL